MSSLSSLPSHASPPSVRTATGPNPGRPQARTRKTSPAPISFRFPAHPPEDAPHRDAELFYLQKQIQAQTQMAIVLEDGERVEGCIEWYDRNSLKVRGRQKSLIYKAAIKFMYKFAENGQR